MNNNLHIRHDLKTFLNHIVGYCEILIEDAKEYKRIDLIPGIEQILGWAEKLKRLIHFYYDKSTESPSFSSDEVKKAFYLPLMQIVTDARRLIVLFRQKAPNFVSDMEQLLSVATQMYDLIEKQVIDLAFQQVQQPEPTAYPLNTPEPSSFALEPTELPEFDALEYEDTLIGERAIIPAHLFIIDDSPMSQTLISRHLKALGHSVSCASSGEEAFRILSQNHQFDIIILDVLMPGMSGMQILKVLKENRTFSEIPVIMMSMVDHSSSIAHCIKLGAEDYLPKDFDPVILRARIDACLEKSRLHKQQEVFIKALLESQQTLANELSDAADYVVGLLPPDLEGPIQTSMALVPSTELGGDFCAHHRLDGDHISFYVLDVSGHGIKSALLAVSISNLIKNQGLPDTDFTDPGQVLTALNLSFQLDNMSTTFFTIWYGVYNTRTRILRYSNGGSPPGILISSLGTSELSTGGLLLGASDEASYETAEITIPTDGKLYLYSDGVYEISRSNGQLLGLQEFIRLLPHQVASPAQDIENLLTTILGITMNERFSDDVCIFEALFP